MSRAWPVLLLCAASAAFSTSARAAPDGEAAPQVPTTTPSGAAQQREASERYDRAFQLYDEGAYDAALAELERAYELAPSFRILFNLGVMSLDVHDTATAMAYFERYLAEGGDSIPHDVRAQVEDELRTLAGRVAQVRIDVNVPGAEISIDDRVIGVSPLQHVVRVNAGTRRIAARANGWLPDSMLVSIAGGDEREFTLRLSDPQPRPSPTPPAPPPAPQRNIPWFGFGATAALAGGAIFSGIQAVSAQREFEHQRRTLGVSADDLERADARAFRWSVAADTLTVAALGVGAYSVYLMLSDPEAEPSDAASAAAVRVELMGSGVAVRGRF